MVPGCVGVPLYKFYTCNNVTQHLKRKKDSQFYIKSILGDPIKQTSDSLPEALFF